MRARPALSRLGVLVGLMGGVCLMQGGLSSASAAALERCPIRGNGAGAFPCFSEVGFGRELTRESGMQVLEQAGIDLVESRPLRDGALVVVRSSNILEALAEHAQLTLLRRSRDLRCDRPGPGRGRCEPLVLLNDTLLEVTHSGPGSVVGLEGRRGDDTFINDGELVVSAESLDPSAPNGENAVAATGISGGVGEDLVQCGESGVGPRSAGQGLDGDTLHMPTRVAPLVAPLGA